MQVFFVLTMGMGLLLMFLRGNPFLSNIRPSKTKHEAMVHVGEKPLIFTIDNLFENTIVSVSSAAEFNSRTGTGYRQSILRHSPADRKILQLTGEAVA